MSEMYDKYIEYIKNTGGSPSIFWFDEDWEPIGPDVRRRMASAGLIKEQDGRIILTQDPENGEDDE